MTRIDKIVLALIPWGWSWFNARLHTNWERWYSCIAPLIDLWVMLMMNIMAMLSVTNSFTPDIKMCDSAGSNDHQCLDTNLATANRLRVTMIYIYVLIYICIYITIHQGPKVVIVIYDIAYTGGDRSARYFALQRHHVMANQDLHTSRSAMNHNRKNGRNTHTPTSSEITGLQCAQ